MRGEGLETAGLSRRECCNEEKWLSHKLATFIEHHANNEQCGSRLCAVTEVTHLKIETETNENDKKMIRGWAPHDPQVHPKTWKIDSALRLYHYYAHTSNSN
jgi:hypothetical protein